MRVVTIRAVVVVVGVFCVGCGSPMAGKYVGDARVIPGKQETGEEGYSLDEVRARVQEDGRSITLNSDGRYVHRFSADSWQEGTWRVEGDTLILSDDAHNGNVIVPALRAEHEFAIGESGEIVDPSVYSRYNLEVIYVKQ